MSGFSGKYLVYQERAIIVALCRRPLDYRGDPMLQDYRLLRINEAETQNKRPGLTLDAESHFLALGQLLNYGDLKSASYHEF